MMKLRLVFLKCLVSTASKKDNEGTVTCGETKDFRSTMKYNYFGNLPKKETVVSIRWPRLSFPSFQYVPHECPMKPRGSADLI